MLDDLANFSERFFAAQCTVALEVANWLIRQIERIPEPVRKHIPFKTERPSDYEIVEPGQYD